MTAVNKFYPFASDAAASVQTDTVYAADSQRILGAQSGVYRGTFMNKAIRQAAKMAQLIGDMIVAASTVDVTDSMSSGDFATAFLKTIQDALVIPARGNFRGVTNAVCSGSTPRVVTVDDMGKIFALSNSSDTSCIIQLPSLSATGMYAGASVMFVGGAGAYNHSPVFYSVTEDSAVFLYRNAASGASWSGGDLTWTFLITADPANSKWIMTVLDCPEIPT